MVSEEPSVSSGGIPIRNAWYLLLYAWDLATWRERFPAAVEASPSLLGLLARVLADTTEALVRRGIGRQFLVRHELVPGVRGRIDFACSLKHLDFEAGRAQCVFSQLDLDTPRNRILRWTLDRLRRDPRVDHTDAARAEEIRQRVGSLVVAMEGVTLTPVTTTVFAQVQIGRNDRAYALPLAICKLVHRLQMPTERVGDHALVGLQRDAIAFQTLFERFVRNFWRYHLDGYDVMSETLDWFDELANPLVPRMHTDITLTSRRPPHRRLVVDTKYSATTLSAGRYGVEKFKSENLYQIYAYLRTQECRGDAYRGAEGMLLYPTTAREVDEAMMVQGHRIRIATVNLAARWEDIHARLLTLVGQSATRQSWAQGGRGPSGASVSPPAGS